jgi:hypothetical protein
MRDIQGPVRGLEPPLQRLDQADRVEGLELCGVFGDDLRLVGLQVPDGDPPHIGQLGGFGLDLLRLVLRQFVHPRRHRLPQPLDGHGLAHREEADVGGVAPGGDGGGVHPAPDGVPPLTELGDGGRGGGSGNVSHGCQPSSVPVAAVARP